MNPRISFSPTAISTLVGAIKFGDELELSVCKKLVSGLQSCKAPFQCAHGRPSLVPLIDIQKLKHNLPITIGHIRVASLSSADHYSQFSSSQKKNSSDLLPKLTSKYFDDNDTVEEDGEQ